MVIACIVLGFLALAAFMLALSLGKVASATPPLPPKPLNLPIEDHCGLHPEYFFGCENCESCKVFAVMVAEFNKGEK